MLGYAEETAGGNYAASVMSGASNLADWQMIAGGLCGLFGIFLEGLACFRIRIALTPLKRDLWRVRQYDDSRIRTEP